MQKIKTPGTIITQASKSVKAEFILDLPEHQLKIDYLIFGVYLILYFHKFWEHLKTLVSNMKR